FSQHWPNIARDLAASRSRHIEAVKPFAWTHVSARYEAVYNHAIGRRVRTILGVPILATTERGAIEVLDRAALQSPPKMVAFANANALNCVAVHPNLRDAFRKGIIFNDGIEADLASSLLYGSRFPENLSETDFTPAYLTKTKHRFQVFVLGGRPGTAERAIPVLRSLAPQHAYVGAHHGFFEPDRNSAVIAAIRASGANLLLVAMGNPKQEMWLSENLALTGCRMGLAVGALLDFLIGDFHRAPQWVRSLRLEWLYRMAQEPKRLLWRYCAGNPAFLARVSRQYWSGVRVCGPALADELGRPLQIAKERPVNRTEPLGAEAFEAKL
ncbi:MAG TPA: WecB/TagA/CpsF family glycosyltransferase, partial [Aestuariivirgaceae bacterium]|nr:WecB/TagA/CpsF family glycosyltransferase [Aestuariivirgaceae bacterium]